MTLLTILYGLNGTLLLLHEIESAYEREWEIFGLPGGISGFLALHVPVLLLLFFGLLEIAKGSPAGTILGVIFGVGGSLPFLVHNIFVRRPDRFRRLCSQSIIFANLAVGAVLAVFSLALSVS